MPNWEVAVLESVNLKSSSPFQRKSITALRDRILSELRAKVGGVTSRNLRAISGVAERLKASDAAVRKEIGAMKEEGLIESRKPTADERKRFKLSQTVREVLVPV
jgi:DNA-binding MarR family transcriptional regulator